MATGTAMKARMDRDGRLVLPAELGARDLYSVILAPRTGGGVSLVLREGERNLPLPTRVISRRVGVDKSGAVMVPSPLREVLAKTGGAVSISASEPGIYVIQAV